MGLFPDIGSVQKKLDEKFEKLIQKLDEILQELRNQRRGDA